MIRRDEPSTSEPHLLRNGNDGPEEMLSVVVPVYDEETIVPILVDRVLKSIDALEVSAEVILVDDGSRDGTLAAIARSSRKDSRIVGLSLSRNFGHQAAISAGLAETRGSVIVVMDGDLQDPPEAIGALWERLKEGYDVVYAVRKSRPENPLKRWTYLAHYRLLRAFGTVEIPVDAGDFGIMTRRVVDAINAMPERRRYLRGLRAWVGFHQAGVEIDREERHSGRPKFTLGKLMALAVDGFIGFSDLPLRLIGIVGALALLSTAIASGISLATALTRLEPPSGWMMIGMLVGLALGIQSLGMAVLGTYLSRILDEVRGRPLYLVSRRIDNRPRVSKRKITDNPKHRPKPFR